MVHVPRNRQSPSVCQKRGGLVQSYRRRSEAKPGRNAKPSGISQGAEKPGEKSLHANVRARPSVRSGAKGVPRHRVRHFRDKRAQLHAGEAHGRALPQRRKPLAPENAGIRASATKH
jgi:hypothetical protein